MRAGEVVSLNWRPDFISLICFSCNGRKSQHSGTTIISRCKNLIQQILGGYIQVFPGIPLVLSLPSEQPEPDALGKKIQKSCPHVKEDLDEKPEALPVS